VAEGGREDAVRGGTKGLALDAERLV
jgi:hypothetical protein